MRSKNQMILNSRFYTEFRGDDKDLDELVRKVEGPNGLIDFSTVVSQHHLWGTTDNAGNISTDTGRVGFITHGLPKKSLFNKIAKVAKVNFTVISVNESEMEPSLILEYQAGKLIDEQTH